MLLLSWKFDCEKHQCTILRKLSLLASIVVAPHEEQSLVLNWRRDIHVMLDVDIPVYRDVISLFKFISFTGASTFVPFREENEGTVAKLMRGLQRSFCFCIFLLLLSMSLFEIYQFALVVWQMKNIGEIIPNMIWITSFPLAVMAQVFYTVL